MYFSLNSVLYNRGERKFCKYVRGTCVTFYMVLIIYNTVLIIKKHFYFCKFLVDTMLQFIWHIIHIAHDYFSKKILSILCVHSYSVNLKINLWNIIITYSFLRFSYTQIIIDILPIPFENFSSWNIDVLL